MRNNFILPVACAAALASTALMGMEDVSFGLRAGLGLPAGGLKDTVDGKAGFSAGGFALLDLGGGHALRPRFDFTQFRGDDARASFLILNGVRVDNLKVTQANQVNSWSIGTDYLYFFEGATDRGFYALAGAALATNRQTTDVTAKSKVGTSTNMVGAYATRSTRAAFNLGLGYQFSPHFALEAGYQVSTLGAHAEPAWLRTPPSTVSTQSGRMPDTAAKSLQAFTLAGVVRF